MINLIKTEDMEGKDMDDASIRISMLCDADECAFNELLKDARSKSTIKELEMEYWSNFIGCQNGVTAYVDRNQMRFLPFQGELV